MLPLENLTDRRRRDDRRASTAHPLGDELAAAIGLSEVDVLFQPQYHAESGALLGAEALVRWSHPQRGVVAGDELFRIAERSGLARVLSAYVFEAALVAARDWPGDLQLSLNVTANDLAAPDFVDQVASALGATQFAPEHLTLEITEQALVGELEQSAARLSQLVNLGVQVALDDFGAGFCNFRYLKTLPLHHLKLDRSMIEGIADDVRDLEVLRGIVAMASALDLAVIAEGIETHGQLDAIRREGCAAWQGYLGARPMPAAAFAALAKGQAFSF